MKSFFTIISLVLSIKSFSATVDTISIYSSAMKTSFNCVVIKPVGYDGSESQYPVLYLLHGRGGNYASWVKSNPELKNFADANNFLLVCPDGKESWFLDSPVDSSIRFETYIITDVVHYIDTHYKTVTNRRGRAIMGVSMGGHGALFLAFRHPDLFGACGSISGGPLDYYLAVNKARHTKNLGDSAHYGYNWRNLSVVNVIEHYSHKDSLAIIFDCGTEDQFYVANKILHEKMLSLKIPHDFIQRPGDHDETYFTNSADFQFLFFKKYFGAMKKKLQ
jgi:S-formylglutathione hydrolase FrmB